MIEAEYDNFIGIYDNVVSKEFCDKLIDHLDWCNKNNRTWNRHEAESIKKDTATLLNKIPDTLSIDFSFNQLSPLISEFNDVFWNICYKDYTDNYSLLNNYSNHTIYSYKIQKTQKSGGYHVWHCEDGERYHATRVGVYILYLNDVEDGGETEFLYLSKRVKAKQGRLVIFPPNYPWAHRGNPPLTGDKYILTGWTEFN